MIKVLIPKDYDFNYKQCKKLYKKYKKDIGDNQEFRDIVKNTFFYSFFDDDSEIPDGRSETSPVSESRKSGSDSEAMTGTSVKEFQGKHIGCIYYYKKDGKLFVNAFANRHTHKTNIECLKMSFDWFNCDIYAQTQHKTAIYCLYKCGFKKVHNNLYKYERR